MTMLPVLRYFWRRAKQTSSLALRARAGTFGKMLVFEPPRRDDAWRRTNMNAPINNPELFFIDGKWTKLVELQPRSTSSIQQLRNCSQEWRRPRKLTWIAPVAAARKASRSRPLAAHVSC